MKAAVLNRRTAPTLHDLAAAAKEAIARARPKLRDRGVVVQMSGAEAGRVHPVPESGLTLGRGHDCTIRFDDASLSRAHACIRRLGGDHLLEDPGSLNGSFVNDARVRTAVLADGDRIRLGSGLSLRFHVLNEDEEKALLNAYESSLRDGLTGIFNRRYIQDRLVSEVSYAVRHATELSVVLVDLDHFKKINDTFGHLAGDAVLRHVAALMSSHVRVEDVVARYGGEELIIVARGIPLRGAVQLAERIRRAIADTSVTADVRALNVTASLGVASLGCCEEQSPTALIGRADERLYKAKGGGRNRVVAS